MHYRRRLNFLSRQNYTRSERRYRTNQVQPIVAVSTTPYHAALTKKNPSTTPTTKKARKLMNIAALVLAGGEGSRLYPLTAEHAKRLRAATEEAGRA